MGRRIDSRSHPFSTQVWRAALRMRHGVSGDVRRRHRCRARRRTHARRLDVPSAPGDTRLRIANHAELSSRPRQPFTGGQSWDLEPETDEDRSCSPMPVTRSETVFDQIDSTRAGNLFRLARRTRPRQARSSISGSTRTKRADRPPLARPGRFVTLRDDGPTMILRSRGWSLNGTTCSSRTSSSSKNW
jgi:hypothetical protein